jgi:hypothetical protein
MVFQTGPIGMAGWLTRARGAVLGEFSLTLKWKYFIRELNFECHSFNYSAYILEWSVAFQRGGGAFSGQGAADGCAIGRRLGFTMHIKRSSGDAI